MNCTSDAPHSTARVAEPAAPPTPPIPLHTPADVLVEMEAVIALSDTLPLSRMAPPSESLAHAPADTAGAPRTDATSVSDSTQVIAAAPSSEPPTEQPAAALDDSTSVPQSRLDPAPANTGEAAAHAPTAPAQHRPSTPQARTSAFASAVAGTLPDNADTAPGITGLVTDETQTRIGRDFYSAFYDRWQAPQSNRYYTVTVAEQPMPSLGTRVLVRVNQQVVFATRLQPRNGLVREAAERAVYVTQRRLQSKLSTTAY